MNASLILFMEQNTFSGHGERQEKSHKSIGTFFERLSFSGLSPQCYATGGKRIKRVPTHGTQPLSYCSKDGVEVVAEAQTKEQALSPAPLQQQQFLTGVGAGPG